MGVKTSCGALDEPVSSGGAGASPERQNEKGRRNEPCSFLVAAISRVAAAGQSRLEDEPPARPVLPDPPSASDPPEPPEPPEPPAPPQPPASAHNTHPRWPARTHTSHRGLRPSTRALFSTLCGVLLRFFYLFYRFDLCFCERIWDIGFVTFLMSFWYWNVGVLYY